MLHILLYQLLLLIPVLLRGVSALPGGCGGTLEILDVESDEYNGTVWACAGIDRSSLFWGLDALLSSSDQDNSTDCANFCATMSWPDGLMAGIFDSDNSTCECWYIGDLNYYNIPAADPGVTFIDFFEAWGPGGRPSKAQNWGVFTCPEGASSGGADGGAAKWCGPLSVEPAKPALAKLGIIGGCWGFCQEYGDVQWILSTAEGECNCYDDLAGLKVSLNYSSPWSVVDYWDFMPHPTPSTTPVAKTTSSVKSSSKSSSHTTTKPTSTTKRTSKSSSKTSSKSTSSSKSTTHSNTSSSKISSKTTSKPTSSSKSTTHLSTSSSKTSSKSTTHSTSSSTLKISSKTSSKTTSPSKSSSHPPSTSTSKISSKTSLKTTSSIKPSTHSTSSSKTTSSTKSSTHVTSSSSSTHKTSTTAAPK